MKTLSIIVRDKSGLHLRPAAKIVEKSLEYKSRIVVSKGDRHADGTSILELMLLQAGHNAELKITASGEDESQALNSFSNLFDDGAGI